MNVKTVAEARCPTAAAPNIVAELTRRPARHVKGFTKIFSAILLIKVLWAIIQKNYTIVVSS